MLKNDPLIDLGMNGFDEIFMDSSELEKNRLPKIFQIPLTEIDEFPDHPFKVKMDEDMASSYDVPAESVHHEATGHYEQKVITAR